MIMGNRIMLLGAFAASFALTAAILYFLIPVLRKMKVGQRILDIGPEWHKAKEGTPTMGGIAFLLSASVCALVTAALLGEEIKRVAAVIVYAVLCGLIGITDDAKKLRMRRNEGLSAGGKFALQLLVSGAFIFILRRYGLVNTEIYVPFYGKNIDLCWFYYLFAMLFLTGFGNAVNLTDGLDGLCTSVTGTLMFFLALLGIKTGDTASVITSICVLGGCLGFLIFNFHPAKVFMGDTGSLFLGAVVSGTALAAGDPLLIFILGAVYVSEAASVIIQVLYFKLTGKRFFLMAPLHHHLEKKKMSENAINALFVAVTAVMGAFCYYFW